jgi:hypothetical protein
MEEGNKALSRLPIAIVQDLSRIASADDETQMLIASLDAAASAEQSLPSPPVRAKPESRAGEHAI